MTATPPTRLHVSTDSGSIGIWDLAEPASGGTIEEAVERGHACILRMEGDCGGAADIFVDQEFPAGVMAETMPFGEEQMIAIRSGDVVVDGIEYFGSKTARAGAATTWRLPVGTYRVAVRRLRDEDELGEPLSEKELRRVVGAANVAYYDRINRNGLLIGFSTLLLLPLLLFVTRWYVAVPITLVMFLGYFPLLRRVIQRNPRYRVLDEQISILRHGNERPLLAIRFSRV